MVGPLTAPRTLEQIGYETDAGQGTSQRDTDPTGLVAGFLDHNRTFVSGFIQMNNRGFWPSIAVKAYENLKKIDQK